MSTFDIAQDMYAGSGLGDPLGLTGAWNAAEFNVFGDGNSTEANFSSGTTFSVAIDVGGDATCTTPIHGVTASPTILRRLRAWRGRPVAPGKRRPPMAASSSRKATRTARNPFARQPTLYTARRSVLRRRRGVLRDRRPARMHQRAVRSRPPPVLTCNGTRRPTQACSSGWTCCDSSWVCGHCQ